MDDIARKLRELSREPDLTDFHHYPLDPVPLDETKPLKSVEYGKIIRGGKPVIVDRHRGKPSEGGKKKDAF